MQREDGGPAFPADDTKYFSGMTLRDWFAGQALAGLAGMVVSDGSDFLSGTGTRSAAQWAYRYADAMIKARSK